MSQATPAKRRGPVMVFLDCIEWIGNKLPDPAVLFVIGIVTVWILSAILSRYEFSEKLPGDVKPIAIINLLALEQIAVFLSGMTKTFVEFHPVGVVLVAMLGVGVAEHSGFINACLKSLLAYTPQKLLSPMVILVAAISHTAADAGYVLVIPLAGMMFYAAGRHPLVGIAAGFAGVSGGFSANLIPSAIDPLLAGLTNVAVNLVRDGYSVNPLCNWFFTGSSTFLIVGLGWFVTDFVVEPRFRKIAVDGDPDAIPRMPEISGRDRMGMMFGLGSMVIFAVALTVWAVWPGSALQHKPESNLLMRLTASDALLMKSIVPLIFIFFVIPGIVHGYVSGTFKSHRDVVKGMSKAMESMGYYLALIFFVALFTKSFADSQMARLLAVKGANWLEQTGAGVPATIGGIIALTALVNLLVGSASGKWAMLAPIFVPMLMLRGISPEFTQAAYRVGDSTTNIITPMMPYFPLVVIYCQRYVKNSGIGTVTSMMLPYSIVFLVAWSGFLFLFWQLGIPLGLNAPYVCDPVSVIESINDAVAQ